MIKKHFFIALYPRYTAQQIGKFEKNKKVGIFLQNTFSTYKLIVLIKNEFE